MMIIIIREGTLKLMDLTEGETTKEMMTEEIVRMTVEAKIISLRIRG